MKISIPQSLVIFIMGTMLFISTAYAQNKVSVTGTVKNDSGTPLAGASVTVKESQSGTFTDSSGGYHINLQKGQTLIFNNIGYKPFAQKINGDQTLNVTLKEGDNKLDEVVVIGYGTQSKSSVTGAVSKLTNKNLDEMPTAQLDNALIGKIAGVTIQNTTSEVGVDPVVRVRGFNSINPNAAPLVVVDGYPVPDGLSFVNPQDVASIEVLKDAASAAIYGSRAANGVILITTKSGVADKPKYNIKAYYGKRSAYELNPIMTFTEYTEKLYREAAIRENDPTVPANKTNLILDTERAAYILENQIVGQATDWQKLALRDADIYNVQVGISGGKRETKYYISGNYQSDEGIMKYSNNTRMSVKTKLDASLSKKLKFSINFNPSFIKTERPASTFTDYYRMYSFIPVYHNENTIKFIRQNAQWNNVNVGDYAQARHFNGYVFSGTMPDGKSWTSTGTVDPWNTANNTPLSIADREKRESQTFRFLSGADVSYEIIPKLIFKSSLSGYYSFQQDQTFTKRNARQDGGVNQAVLTERNYLDFSWENTLNYNKKINNHNIALLLGNTVQQTWINVSNLVGRNFPTDKFETLNQAAQIDQSLTYTIKDQIGLLSYLGRIQYDYKGKYLLSASYRVDGSSYFAPGHKYGSFPSASIGWVVSKEPFMRKVDDVISNLKLRFSYGATGNNRIASFAYENLLYPANYSFGGGTSPITLGLAPNANLAANQNITWERTFEFNSGLDLGLFNNRISLALEYYHSITDRLLFNQATMAFTGSYEYINNAGKVRNNGIEIELTGVPIRKNNFNWTVSFNLAANKNKLLELGGEPVQYNFGERNEVYAAIVGSPSIQFYGYKTDGVWLSDKDIAAAKAAGQTSSLTRYFQAGGLKFVDVNNDNRIDENDRVPIGTPFADFTWGLNNTIKYKNLDVYFLFQGSHGGKLINGDLNYNESKRFNKKINTDSRWLSENYPGDGRTPYFTNGENWMFTDYAVENASYASLRSLIVGYQFLGGSKPKIKSLSGLRLYFSAENLLYFMGKGYRGINPEARLVSSMYASPLISGYQRGAFPLMRTYTIGIDIDF